MSHPLGYNPLLPSSVTSSTSEPLSPQGTPVMPPGLVTPHPTGMGLDVSMGMMVPGMSPQVTSDPVLQAVAEQQMRSMMTMDSRSRMMSGSIEKTFGEMQKSLKEVTDALSKAAAQVADAVRQAAPGTPRTGAGTRTPRPVDSPEATASEVSRGRAPRLTDMKGDEPEGKPLPSLRRLPFGEAAQSFSMASVGQRAAGHLAKMLQDSQAQSGWQQVEGEDTWVRWRGKGMRATAEQAGALRGRALNARVNALGSAGAVARGASISSALPGLGRVAGPVGFLAGGALAAGHMMTEQREANRVYQQITGGPNFSITDPRSGVRQRLGETLFRGSMFGTMGGQDSRDLYLGIAQTGLQGGARQDALDFAVKQFRKTGMDVGDSIQLIEQSVRNGVDTFGTLSEALDKVGKTARDTGQNVQVIQRAFAQTLGTVQAQVTPTAAAPVIAAGIQQQISRQGHLLGSQLDFGGMLSQPALMMQAAQLGQTPMAYMAKIQEDPALLGQGMQSQVNRVRDAVFNAQALQWAHEEARKAMALTGGQLTPGDAAEIGRKMSENGMLNPMQFMQVAAAMGMGGVTPANVYEVAAKVALGGFRFDQALSPRETQPLEGGGKTIGGQKVVTAGDYRDIKGGDRETARRAGGQNLTIEKSIGISRESDLSKAGSEYLEYVHGSRDAHGRVTAAGSGTRSSVMEALLRDEKGLRDKHFIVQTKDGPKTVSFEDAFKNYSDQLARGDVTVQETGETVAQTTGKMGDRSVATGSAGQPAAKGAKAPTATAGSVTIYADDELKRIIRIVASGGATYDQARRQGVPAPAFPPTPSEYPSATGGG